MLVRIIILGAVIALAVMLYRKWQSAGQGTTRNDGQTSAMKKCAQCGIHLPEQDAIRSGEHFFCSEQHRLEHAKQHPPHE